MQVKLREILGSHWPLFLILLVAILLRIWRIEELTTFLGDQGYDFLNIKGIIEGNLTLLGPKIGPYNNVSTLYLGPFYYYLLAPFLWITKLDPIGASYAIVISRLIVVLFVYLISKKLFNLSVAIYASIIAVLSPYWLNSLGPPSNPYFLLPIVLLITYLLILKTKNAIYSHLIVGVLSGLAIQLHYISVILIPTIALFIYIKDRIFNIKIYSSYFLGLLVGLLPVLIFEVRNKYFITGQVYKQITAGSFKPSIVGVLDNINSVITFTSQDITGLNSIKILSAILILSGIIYSFILANATKKSILIFLVILLLLNLLVLFFYPEKSQSHYLALVYPSLFIFTGVAIYLTGKAYKYLPVLIVIFISIFLVQNNNLLLNNGYTMPQDLTLAQMKKITKIISEDVGKQTFNVASTLDGDARAMPYRYLLEVNNKYPENVETYDSQDSLYVITREPATSIVSNTLFEIASFQPSNIAKIWEINGNIRLIKLSKLEKLNTKSEKFITIVNPVRSRELWVNNSINSLKKQINTIESNGLKSTWLLQYDTLFDQEIIDTIKNIYQNSEVGIYLEVSEKLATDSRVPYKNSQGDYYRPDKVFLFGYDFDERTRMIDSVIEKFEEIYGYKPKSVGAWNIDSYSFAYLSKLGITASLTVSDQYNTDSQAVWGQYFSMPFYPSKYNSLEPAFSQKNKIPITNIQWAQRDLTLGYGPDIKDSRNSFQANDYINNSYDFSYFIDLLDDYLSNESTDFMQITIGLEAGQEAVRFAEEFEKQISFLASMSKERIIKSATMTEFSNWYQDKYPGISPPHLLRDDSSIWYMNPKFRVAIFKEGNNYILKDLRYYTNSPNRQYFYADNSHFLNRRVNALIDDVKFNNHIDLGESVNLKIEQKWDSIQILLDSKTVLININGVYLGNKLILKNNEQYLDVNMYPLEVFNEIKSKVKSALDLLKYSVIDSEPILGVMITKNKMIGIRNFIPGIYTFEYQLTTKFISPSKFLENIQPWLI